MKIRVLWMVPAVTAFICGLNIQADELSNETSLGAASQIDALSFLAKDSRPLSWNVGYTFDRTVTGNPAGDISDITNEVTGGFDWDRDWQLGAGLTYTSTPSEYLSSVGPNVTVGYEWKFGSVPEKNQDASGEGLEIQPFRSTFGLNSKIAWVSYRESFPSNPTAKKSGLLARPANVAEQIGQTGWTWELNTSPWAWLSFRASVTKFYYNRNVQRFLQLLDSQRAVAAGVSSFSTTLQGFQERQDLVEFTFYPADEWETVLQGNLARSETDGTYAHGLQYTAAKTWGDHWKTSLGYEYDNGQGTMQSLGMFEVTYLF